MACYQNIFIFIIVEPGNLDKACMGVNIALKCTAYDYILWTSNLFEFNFDYNDQQGKTLRNRSGNVVARYAIKGNNNLLTTTVTFDLIVSNEARIFCIGRYGPNEQINARWSTLFISVVKDSESKLH